MPTNSKEGYLNYLSVQIYHDTQPRIIPVPGTDRNGIFAELLLPYHPLVMVGTTLYLEMLLVPRGYSMW